MKKKIYIYIKLCNSDFIKWNIKRSKQSKMKGKAISEMNNGSKYITSRISSL